MKGIKLLRVNKKSNLYKGLLAIFAAVLSGFLWYFANDLSGNYGYLMGFAPVLVLIFSLQTSAAIAFLTAFTASLIGRLSWFSYLVSILSLPPTLLFMIMTSLFFALIVVGTRKIVVKTNAWYSVFAFPALFTTYEFLIFNFAPDGTAGSIAYTQLNYLPVVQIASITGILGITFLIMLFSSAIALTWHFRRSKKQLRMVTLTTGTVLVSILIFGTVRIANSSADNNIKVGIVVLDEAFHHVTDQPDPQKEELTAERYIEEIIKLADQGAQMIVLPERAVNITKENEQDIITMFRETAMQNHLFIVLGYTNFRTDTAKNSALVIDANGKLVVQYDKARLINSLEDQFLAGTKIGTFDFNEISAGTAICKDLDFADYISEYSQIAVMAIPAWDFVVDGWLHSRMAVLRGVESGFSEVRAARQGRLTISDCYGRIIKEADSSKNNTLLGNLSYEKQNTIYGKFGEWFGFLNTTGALVLVLLVFRRRR